MDPNATLDRIRELVKEYDQEGWLDTAETGEFVEAVRDLDEWLSKRGFKPDAWK